MVDYTFYTETYNGNSISAADWATVEARAENVLSRYKRIYTVTEPTENAEKMAICAIADAVFFYNSASNGQVYASSSIGSVSSSVGQLSVDISPRSQEKEFYRCASMYLDIYRGVC